MTNINTPEFWDKEFKEEKDVMDGKKSGFWRWMPHRFESIARHIPRGSKILDVGCGLGHFCRYMQARRPDCYYTFGTDFSEFAIESAQHLDSESVYFVSDAYKFSGIDIKFDVVVAQEIIEHLSDVPRFLQEIKKAVKPGGIVIVTTPEKMADIEVGSPDHVHEFTGEELVETMAEICSHGKVHYHKPDQEMETMIFVGTALE